MARSQGLICEKSDILARAVEYVHAASLAHDDVIDQAETRRGRDSINIAAGNKKSVLAGDYLLSQVIVELCKLNHPEVVSEMASIISLLAKGEWLQSDAILHRNYTDELIIEIARCKTGSVMGWTGSAQAILNNLKETSVYGREFGLNLGISFQLLDDTLDFSKDSQKDQGLDLKNGQLNSVYLNYLKQNKDIFDDFRKGKSIIEKIDFKSSEFESAISQTREESLHYATKATAALEKYFDSLIKEDEKYKKHVEYTRPGLEAMVKYLLQRSY